MKLDKIAPMASAQFSSNAVAGLILVVIVSLGGCQASGSTAVPAVAIPAAPATRPIVGNVLELNDPAMRFVRISPNAYGFDQPDFFMLETEVTNETYARYLAEVGGKKDDDAVVAAIKRRWDSGTWSTIDPSYSADNPALLWKENRPPAGQEQLPVAMVNPEAASGFCAWLTRRHGGYGVFRLPTKTEWLIAAYGRDRKFPWGDQLDEARYLHSPFKDFAEKSEHGRKAWAARFEAHNKSGASIPMSFASDDAPETVRARPAGRTPEGLFNMWGNVSELVIPDVRKENRYVAGLGAKWMGGGFDDFGQSARQDYWGYTHSADVRQQSIGFRVLLDVSPEAHTYRQQLGDDAEMGGSIYGHPDEWPRPSRWPPAQK